MRKNAQIAWTRLEMMIRAGVPHAVDISAELVRHDLLTPLSELDPSQQVDLQFYFVVHRAYKSGVLSEFMCLLAALKQGKHWSSIQNSQESQLWIVQHCLGCESLNLAEAVDQVSHFLLAADGFKKKGA